MCIMQDCSLHSACSHPFWLPSVMSDHDGAKAQADQLEAERMAMQSIDWWVLALLPNGTAFGVLHCWYRFW